MGRRGDLCRRDARARLLSADSERRAPARQVAAIKHRLFVPSARPPHEPLAPLVVALHGCTQTSSDFAAGTRFDTVAERFGAYVLYPEQSVAANPNRCWNWFLGAHQHRDGGEPAQILSLVNDIVARHPIDRARIFVAGLSAGGAMAAILAEQAPDVFAAAGIMAGVALHASHDVSTAFAAMNGDVLKAHLLRIVTEPVGSASIYGRLRLSVWAGARDRLVVPQNASILVDQFLQLLGLGAREGELERREDADIVRFVDDVGRVRIEAWRVNDMGHAWSGGSFRGSHTWPKGPRASDEMMTFFLDDGAAALLDTPIAEVEAS